MVEPASVRLSRLIVPIAAAAAATYVALMRDQRQSRRRRGPAATVAVPVPEPTQRVMQPPSVAVPASFDEQMPAPGTPETAAVPPDLTPTPGVHTPPESTAQQPADAPEHDEATATTSASGEEASGEQSTHSGSDDSVSLAEPAQDGPVLDEGSFSLGGWAAAPGHTVVSAVTYRQRLPFEVAPERIELIIDHSENVPDDGLVVLADPGFAPDREGFTLVLAAADPGPFSVSGTYRAIG